MCASRSPSQSTSCLFQGVAGMSAFVLDALYRTFCLFVYGVKKIFGSDPQSIISACDDNNHHVSLNLHGHKCAAYLHFEL